MESDLQNQLLRRIKRLLIVFMVGMFFSGATAFFLETEVNFLAAWMGIAENAKPETLTGASAWMAKVRDGLHETNLKYPFIAYGTDWLGFAHLVLMVLFIGPYKDPVKNKWVIHFGLICCLSVFPLAIICGEIRGIPWGWRMIDCSFGFFGAIPLWWVKRLIEQVERLQKSQTA